MKAKELFMCFLLGVMGLFATSCDDDVAPSDVPEAVMATFQQMFPAAAATEWEKEKGLYKADFNIGLRDMEAWFQSDGTWARTVKDLNPSEVPEAIQLYVSQNYPNLPFDDADWVETPTEKYYVAELDPENGNDIYLKFSEEGAFIAEYKVFP